MFDQDENGSLNAEEYVMSMRHARGDMKTTLAVAKVGSACIKAGHVALTTLMAMAKSPTLKFLEWCEAWGTMVGRDEDGAITATDFGPRRN